VITHTAVDKVTKNDQCERYSYHRAPSFWLTLNINPQITPQTIIRVLTLEICLTGINVPIVSFKKIVLNFIFGHGITSLVCWLFVLLERTYNTEPGRQCEPFDRMLAGKSYQ
jgi:hypothetical protein